MGQISYYIKKAISMPPQDVLKKVINKITTKANNKLQKSRDLNKSTHINYDVPLIKNSYIDIKELDISNIDCKVAQYLSKMYCSHRFDLLGSGWVKNSYDSIALGIEGHKYDMNVEAPQGIANDYEPIDWQKDYKSGYRWNEKAWYKEQRIGHKLGTDIKVPWEVARFQHLPQLAIFSLVDKNLLTRNIKEFKYQVLDFIQNNPPRLGVNWVCTMDVGIRAANMLIAYDIFRQLDEDEIITNEFKQIFSNSIYEHGIHIVNNLEYSEEITSNHYLSDIAGLLFVSNYLDSTEEIDRWLGFSVQEILSEMKKEFYRDGSNFEASTSYHRLSGELIVFSTALILGLDKDKVSALRNYQNNVWKVKPPLKSRYKQAYSIENDKIIFPVNYIEKLYKIGQFTIDITKPSGEIIQFGDNDSGRFFRLSPNGEFKKYEKIVEQYLNLNNYTQDEELFWDENILDHNTFIAMVGGLFEDNKFYNQFKLETSFISALSKKRLLTYNCEENLYHVEINKSTNEILEYRKEDKYDFNKGNILEEIKLYFYPDCGIYIFKSKYLYLAISAGPNGQNDFGGHAHNDKLSYELTIDGVEKAKDPGTYLYTPLPDRRNQFRSVKSHNSPQINDMEQNVWYEGVKGLFNLKNEAKCKLIQYSNTNIVFELSYRDTIIQRKFIIDTDKIIIETLSNKELLTDNKIFDLYSNGYGKLKKNDIL